MAKNKSGSLDTNVLLRLIVGDVPTQTSAIEDLLKRVSSLQVADVVIFETVFVLQSYYAFSREDIYQSLVSIIRHPKINCNRRLFEPAFAFYREHPKLSLVDCALPGYANLNNATPLYTFDKDLAKSLADTELLS
jgi:predicted nucleic-acid-binding protein